MDKIIVAVLFFCLYSTLQSQCVLDRPRSARLVHPETGRSCLNYIHTSAPFLRHIPDARAGAMGLAGIALTPDANSIAYNTAKLSFANQRYGFALNVTPSIPFARRKKSYYGSAAGYWKLTGKTTISALYQRFSTGIYRFQDSLENPIQVQGRNYDALLLGLSQKIGDHWSIGLNTKILASTDGDIRRHFPQIESRSFTSWALDFSVFYKRSFEGSDLSVGATISNVGPKVSLSADRANFITTNFGLGASWRQQVGIRDQILCSVELNKLLVPSPNRDIFDPINHPGDDSHERQSVLGALITSWADAPHGLREEWSEISFSFGVEYWFNQIFAFRSGFFNQQRFKGGQQYLTAGVGLRFGRVVGSLAFDISTRSTLIQNPAQEAMRATINYQF